MVHYRIEKFFPVVFLISYIVFTIMNNLKSMYLSIPCDGNIVFSSEEEKQDNGLSRVNYIILGIQ